uniref:Ig-like domain-containing protein n=1 Tax=Latimeria chalumnae TaxID=7897 RepID=H3BGM0_LATCH
MVVFDFAVLVAVDSIISKKSLAVGTEVVEGTRGGSIILYCRYPKEDQKDHKLWCKMNKKNFCASIVRTDGYIHRNYTGRVQISDSHGLTTVIMEQLEDSDTGSYLCRTYSSDTVFTLREIILKISKGKTGSEVGTEVVKGTRGGSVILYCRSAGKHSNDPKTWCKLNARNECTHVVRTDGYKNSSYGGRVQISDSNGLATVLMKQLEHSDTGTYLCGTYNIDMVFKLREVTLNISNDSRTSPREVRIPLGGSATLHCSYDKEFYGNCTKVWCKQTKEDYCGSEVFSHGKNEEKEGKTSISDDKTGGIITVTMEHLNTGDTGFYWCEKRLDGSAKKSPESNALEQFSLSETGSEAGSEVVKGTWGGSVILSCRSSNYYPKTWCKMNQWNECSDVVRTDGYKNPSYKGRVQISDSHGLATIIMEQLENSDAGIYWCGTYNTNTVFKLREVILIITQDSRTSPKEVRFPLGGSATVHCRYNKEVYGNHGKVWCKQTKGYYCDSKVYSVENKENTGRTSISDNSTEGAITVTMKQLNTGDAGFYWCGI